MRHVHHRDSDPRNNSLDNLEMRQSLPSKGEPALRWTAGEWRADIPANKSDHCTVRANGRPIVRVLKPGLTYNQLSEGPTYAHEYQGNLALVIAAPVMAAALLEIFEMEGKTLIAPSMGPDCDHGHQAGANKAFNQAASIARAALAKAGAL